MHSGAEVACWAHNPKVPGSKPGSATFLPLEIDTCTGMCPPMPPMAHPFGGETTQRRIRPTSRPSALFHCPWLNPPFLPRFEFRHIFPLHTGGDIRNSNRSLIFIFFHRPRCTANQAPAACTAATLMGAATVAAAMATVAAAPLLPELALSPELPRSGCRLVFRPALVPSRGP